MNADAKMDHRRDLHAAIHGPHHGNDKSANIGKWWRAQDTNVRPVSIDDDHSVAWSHADSNI